MIVIVAMNLVDIVMIIQETAVTETIAMIAAMTDVAVSLFLNQKFEKSLTRSQVEEDTTATTAMTDPLGILATNVMVQVAMESLHPVAETMVDLMQTRSATLAAICDC